MINIECNSDNQEQVLKLIEQALKGVDANITEMDEEITELDIMQWMSYNIKQQRVYLGRIEGRTRELRGEIKEIKESLAPFFELSAILLEDKKWEDTKKRKEAREAHGKLPTGDDPLL